MYQVSHLEHDACACFLYSLPCCLDRYRRQIASVHSKARVRQVECVSAPAATGVEHARAWQPLLSQVLGKRHNFCLWLIKSR